MKAERNGMKRILSLILVFAMVLTFVPSVALAAEKDSILFFSNSQGWEKVYAYTWDANDVALNGTWPGTAMSYAAVNDFGEMIYCVSIPAEAEYIIFNNGNDKKTPDIPLAEQTNNGFYAKDDTYGTYAYTPPARYVAGTVGLTSSAWNTAEDQMTYVGNGIYEITLSDVTASDSHAFKITDGTWDNAWPDKNYALSATEGGSTVKITFNLVSQEITTTVTPPSGGAGEGGDDSTPDEENPVTRDVVIHFRNTSLWSEVRGYAWDSSNTAITEAWPGVVLTETQDHANWYSLALTNVAGAPFGAQFNNGSNSGQTADITIPAEGTEFWYDATKGTTILSAAPDTWADGSVPNVSCNVKLHFADSLGWGGASLYTWSSAGTHTGAWPGTKASLDQKGFYTVSFTAEVPHGSGMNFIFSGGGNQTVDLAISSEDILTGNVERWVQPADKDSEGHYNANIFDNAGAVAISPLLSGNTVTFAYKGSAASVEVYGSWDDWKAPLALTANAYGVWSGSLTLDSAGIYEYKFCVDGAETWITDPVNRWTQNGNSAFLISSSVNDNNTVTIRIHYTRADGNYENWNASVWSTAKSQSCIFQEETGAGVVTTFEVDGRSVQEVNFKIRKSVGANDWADQEPQVTVSLGNIVAGTIDVYCDCTNEWVENGETKHTMAQNQVLNSDIVYENKISYVELDYDKNTIDIQTYQEVSDAAKAFTLVHVDEHNVETPVNGVTVVANGSVYTLKMPNDLTLDLVTLYQYKIKFNEQKNYAETRYDIGINTVYASNRFDSEYTYTAIDKELGATYSAESTTFKVWAPTAEAVSLRLYMSGTAGTNDQIGTDIVMTRGEKGVWSVTVDGNQNGVYYTYAVTVDGETVEVVDPYARAAGVNGKRGMIIDLDATDPEGWGAYYNPNSRVNSYTDAIIYELHVRDFSIDASSGMTNKGKYLAFTESGTTVNSEGTISTGIDYLKKLGVNYIHLLPVYDYGSVDEVSCNTFNWGYDPVNYNVPEGSYSTDPYNGAVRVKEFKQMVQSLHNAGISVIMDVVYNHVYNADAFCYNQIVPNYFSRTNKGGSYSEGSGCGNDTASEREMVRKYIVESVLYWAEEYHINGFRFDLVGLLDTQTINQIVEEVHKVDPDIVFYGEGWTMGTSVESGYDMATQANAAKTPAFAYFSDTMRNLLAGDNGKSTGYVSGSTGRENEIVTNFMASPWFSSNPQQVVQYVSCHDNYTLMDKLIISTGRQRMDSSVIKMNNLAAAIYMTSQGISFIHAGEEMLREKINADGTRNHNSYNATDAVNAIKWSNLKKEEYAVTSAYYQGLIALRKAHPALRYSTNALIAANVQNTLAAYNVTAFQIDGNGAQDEDIYVIFNANSTDATVTIPTGEWEICVKGDQAGTTSLGTVSGSVSVDGLTAMVLTRADTGKDAPFTASVNMTGLVTLYFTNDKGWSNVYAYAWSDSANYLGQWPGTKMTYVETNDYGQDVYSIQVSASATNIIFNNGNNTQTVDLNVAVDGTGYYCDGQTDGKWNCSTWKYREPENIGFGKSTDYYLYGFINGENYGYGVNPGKYQFVDGKLTVTFTADSYVSVKNGANTNMYMTKGFLGSVNSATMYSVARAATLTGYDKLMVPGGVEVTFTLSNVTEDTASLSYTADTQFIEDTSGIQNGVTLHCWNWSFKEIEDNMAAIAEQGYTAIQTSPVQPLKEDTADVSSEKWWLYYQPVDFAITDDDGNALGTKAELISMITTAHKYGIKVIVDVVANHLANNSGNDLSTEIPDRIRSNSAYWHDYTVDITDYTNRTDITQHCMGGLPDLNTANDDIQNMVIAFLNECIDAGVDGFRFDAAKHIETPEDTVSSDFWPTVINAAEKHAKTKGKDLYVYGELLYNPDDAGTLPISAYTEYMAVTDNVWSNNLRESIASGAASMMYGYYKPVDSSQLVLWAESHDTYGNANGGSADETEQEINKTWALVAARADAMGLYLARPVEMTQALGVASETGWANAEVKAVNMFHNAFIGMSECIDAENGIVYVERGTSGVVLVNAGGTSANVSVTANRIAAGTYVDQISGESFTVADGKITGKIGETGIAVVYNSKMFDLDGATMTLGNSLDMNFVIDTGKLDSSDNGHYAVIVKENADGTTDSVTIPQAQWKTYKNSATQKYVTFSDVAAKEMTDKLYVTIYNSKGIAVTNKWTDSVRDYCMRAIKYEQEQSTLNLKKLALYVDMLNYGAAAQTYFENYHSDDLATSQLDNTQKAFATSTVTAVNNQVKGKGYLGSTLTLKSNIEMNFVFTKAALVDAQKAVITFTNHRDVAKTVTVTRDQFGEYAEASEPAWYIPVTDMVLSDCCQVDGKSFLMTCTIYDAEGSVITSAQDSVASYLVRGIEDTAGTKDLYSMIQKLATSAYNYFH